MLMFTCSQKPQCNRQLERLLCMWYHSVFSRPIKLIWNLKYARVILKKSLHYPLISPKLQVGYQTRTTSHSCF
jgi:hypothetical protein